MRKLRVAALSISAAACGTGTEVARGPEVVTDTIGDTIVVHTVSGSVWGSDATLTPELSIGEMDGPDEYLFGSVASIAVDDDRNVHVLDRQGQYIRSFNVDAQYVRSWGRRGEGPGELANAAAMAVFADGRILVRDHGNNRVQVFGPGDAPPEEWGYNSGNYGSSEPLWTDRESRTYVVAPDLSQPFGARDNIYIVFDPDGVVRDTLRQPHAGFRQAVVRAEGGGATVIRSVPFSPRVISVMHPDGGFVSGISSDYSIDRDLPDGVLRIERVYVPVRVSPRQADQEREEAERMIGMSIPGWQWDGPPIPETKPPITGLYVGLGGRLWVRVSTEGREVENPDHEPGNPFSSAVRWEAPLRFDVFEADGTYLGAVNPPEDFSVYPPPVFNGDEVWAVSRDELDIQRVVRYRIALESQP